MWSVLKSNPVRTVVTTAYLLFAAVYIFIGFLPAKAASDPISGHLFIPSADISLDVTPSTLTGQDLYVPDAIASSYSQSQNKTLLMAHSSTGFANLGRANIGDTIWYAGIRYRVSAKTTKKIEDIDMRDILSAAQTDTIVLMTCAGQRLGQHDYAERLILQAETF